MRLTSSGQSEPARRVTVALGCNRGASEPGSLLSPSASTPWLLEQGALAKQRHQSHCGALEALLLPLPLPVRGYPRAAAAGWKGGA